MGLARNDAAELLGGVGQLGGAVPVVHVGRQIDELVVVGIERHPAVGHLDHVRGLPALHHRRQPLEGLAPGQRRDLDRHTRIGRLEFIDHRPQLLGARRAGDHLDEADRLGRGTARPEHEGGGRGQ